MAQLNHALVTASPPSLPTWPQFGVEGPYGDPLTGKRYFFIPATGVSVWEEELRQIPPRPDGPAPVGRDAEPDPESESSPAHALLPFRSPSRPELDLASHLGGQTMSFAQYEATFGRPTDAHVFGNGVGPGLRGALAMYWDGQKQRGGKGASDLMVPWMQANWEPWVAVFQPPETFAKENAKMSTSASNPLGTSQYPAIFYVPKEEHRRLVIRPRKYLMDDTDAMLGCLGLENPHRGQNNVKTIALKKTSAEGLVKTLPKDPKSDDYMKLLEGHYTTATTPTGAGGASASLRCTTRASWRRGSCALLYA